MKLLSAMAITLGLVLPAASLAQWQWIDKDGRKVFSDRSPPSDIPAKSILKQPGGPRAPAEAVAVPESTAAPAAGAASAPKIAGKDKALEDKKKQADAAEAEKKKAREEEIAKLRAQNCEEAKRSKMTLDSGVRISRTNAKGEREVLDDAQRAAETKRIEAVVARECKPAGG